MIHVTGTEARPSLKKRIWIRLNRVQSVTDCLFQERQKVEIASRAVQTTLTVRKPNLWMMTVQTILMRGLQQN